MQNVFDHFCCYLSFNFGGTLLAIFWPVVQTGINSFGKWIASSQDTAPILEPFVYGTLERLLLHLVFTIC